MRCYLCGRTLLRAAATVTTYQGAGHAGPTCARRAGLLPPLVKRGPRLFTVPRRRAIDRQQLELA